MITRVRRHFWLVALLPRRAQCYYYRVTTVVTTVATQYAIMTKPHTFRSALRMLSDDHLNIDGSLFLVKCVRKFKSALGGEVTYMRAYVCMPAYLHVRVGIYMYTHARSLHPIRPIEERKEKLVLKKKELTTSEVKVRYYLY